MSEGLDTQVGRRHTDAALKAKLCVASTLRLQFLANYSEV
jgi:hypothetical protein